MNRTPLVPQATRAVASRRLLSPDARPSILPIFHADWPSQASLRQEFPVRSWCDTDRAYHRMLQSKEVANLPQVRTQTASDLLPAARCRPNAASAGDRLIALSARRR